MKRLLIAGCGDLGTRLAGRLDNERWQVTGLRRHAGNLPAPIRPVAADLADPDSLAAVAGDWDAVVYQATPDARDEAAYRRTYVDGLSGLLDRVRCKRLIFVSSTAVYGQDGGEWVDEHAVAEPKAFNGRILRQGESLARDCASDAVVIRFSGIYGPGRDSLIRQVREGRARCRRDPPQWTNRIHADDCAAVLAHVLELPDPEPVYCASDSRPAPRCEVLAWLAGRLGVAGPHDDADVAGGQGKRIDNRRLIASGFTFRHPDYRSGYGEMLQ